MAQWVKALDLQTEGWVFEFQLRKTTVVKTGKGSPPAKRSAIGVSVMGPRRQGSVPSVTVGVAR